MEAGSFWVTLTGMSVVMSAVILAMGSLNIRDGAGMLTLLLIGDAEWKLIAAGFAV